MAVIVNDKIPKIYLGDKLISNITVDIYRKEYIGSLVPVELNNRVTFQSTWLTSIRQLDSRVIIMVTPQEPYSLYYKIDSQTSPINNLVIDMSSAIPQEFMSINSITGTMAGTVTNMMELAVRMSEPGDPNLIWQYLEPIERGIQHMSTLLSPTGVLEIRFNSIGYSSANVEPPVYLRPVNGGISFTGNPYGYQMYAMFKFASSIIFVYDKPIV